MIREIAAPATAAAPTSTDAGSQAKGRHGLPRDPASAMLDRGAQQAAARAPAAAAVISPSALRLPALVEVSSGNRFPVDVRFLGLATDSGAASAARGLSATVIGDSATAGVLIDLAGQRLSLAGARVHLPLGARLTLELLPPGGRAPIRDKAGLDGLVAELQRGATSGALPAAPQPLATPDATLAARLLADWRALGGSTTMRQTGPVGGPAKSEAEEEAMPPGAVDRERESRSAFGLLAEPGAPAQPFVVRRRAPSREQQDESGERLLLTLDLSRLGLITLEMCVDGKSLRAVIHSTEILPADLRESVAQSVVSAAEIGGRAPALVFRAGAAKPLGPALGASSS